MFWRKKEDKTVAPETVPMASQETEPDSRMAHDPDREERSPEPVGRAEEETQREPASFEQAQLEGRVIEAISTVFDPEIPVNIYEMGLIYDIDIDGMSDVKIRMTLTSPACPVAGSLPGDVQRVVEDVDGVRAVDVDLVWEPPWTPDRMTEAAKLELGFM